MALREAPAVRWRWPLKGEAGVSLLETVIAVGLLGLIGVGFASALSTGSRATRTLDEEVMAISLGRSQLAEVQSLAYFDSYTPTISTPPEFSLQLLTEPLDASNTAQKNTVRVFRAGQLLFEVSAYKYKAQP